MNWMIKKPEIISEEDKGLHWFVAYYADQHNIDHYIYQYFRFNKTTGNFETVEADATSPEKFLKHYNENKNITLQDSLPK